ncbi:MAG: proton-conducting transporter membrane subunit [Anaerolineae bacterium]|nr:proton-conducting transporter membrane subunit [Anaerolineae bacterium]
MHESTIPQLIPLVILLPAIGTFINIFWGKKLGEHIAGAVGISMAVLSFIFSFIIFNYLSANHGAPAVVNPPLGSTWLTIPSIGFEIPWQFRVDSITATMLLVVTGVGSLIHIYSYGYMHGDAKFNLFFAYLNMFLMFMLILVTANNYLMMFVGWEGVGVCSYLLIGYYWDKKGIKGWRNSDAARKAMIANRVGDFGLLMSMFLMFWTFGTLNYFSPGEVANVAYTLEYNGYISAAEAKEMGKKRLEGGAAATKPAEAHSEGAPKAEGEHSPEGAHGAGEAHGAHGTPPREELDNSLFNPKQLGIFGQTDYLMSLPVGAPERMIAFGPFEVEFGQMLFLILMFMLLGVTGKSAQIPLWVWLPDAMAGPTPVSALMHAATMVTAGVFLFVRSNVLLDHAPEARFVVAIIGALTALAGGFMALGQWDIKRVLAFSTISQLGFMVAAVGIGAYVAAIFHLVTHAVFKALLFLGSGSVIHGVEHGHHHVHGHAHGHDHDDHADAEHGHEAHGHDAHGHIAAQEEHHEEEFDPQDMRNMGGLWRRMPITFITYMIGTFALMGLPFFAGFWSKDEILLDAWTVGFDEGHLEGYIVFAILLLAAGFTAFYMWRQVQMVFFGEARSDAAKNAPESSWWMLVPLLVLGFFSVFIGLMNVPLGIWPFSEFYKPYEFKHFLESVVPSVTGKPSLFFNVGIAGLATLVAAGAIALAHRLYKGKQAVRDENRDPLELIPNARLVFNASLARLYWDMAYERLIVVPYQRVGKWLYEVVDWRFLHDYFHDVIIKRGYDNVGKFFSKVFDVNIIDGTVNGVGWVVRQFSGRVRGLQTGYVRTYAIALLFGVVAVVVVTLVPLLQNGS